MPDDTRAPLSVRIEQPGATRPLAPASAPPSPAIGQKPTQPPWFSRKLSLKRTLEIVGALLVIGATVWQYAYEDHFKAIAAEQTELRVRRQLTLIRQEIGLVEGYRREQASRDEAQYAKSLDEGWREAGEDLPEIAAASTLSKQIRVSMSVLGAMLVAFGAFMPDRRRD